MRNGILVIVVGWSLIQRDNLFSDPMEFYLR
jgi:hypothetical protein